MEDINEPVKSPLADMSNPTETDLSDPVFEAIWQVIKSWDVNVPEHYSGYMGATGNHVMLILKAVKEACTRMEINHCETYLKHLNEFYERLRATP